MKETKLLRCSCEHGFQDNRYGRRVRLHNACEKGWRCTVCGDVKRGGG